MKKTIITLATVALAASAAQARSLSPAEALGRAMASQETPAAVGAMRAPARVEAALTLKMTGSEAPALYVISRGENQGFLVVSADDIAAPLLGYSDEAVDFNNLPDNFKWWLSQYQAEISDAAAAGAETYTATTPARAAIAPKCTTKWNQDAPYNDLCPKVGSTATFSGCVATAMAQVINYHDYPEKGTGSYSYSWNGRRLTFDYANTTFQWDLMLDDYSGNKGTAEQRNAVATLMYACGVGVNMNYGTDASGAVSARVPNALREYFGFDKGAHTEDRNVYSSEEWADLVYDQIDQNGPVYYSGRGESGGHAFVCDGYKDGYFHFNWGWGGMSDGYFRLNGLTPGSQGIGGNSDGFNTGQSIIAGVCKPKAGSELPAPYIVCSNPMSATVSGNYLMLYGPFTNYSPYDLKGKFSLCIYDAATNTLSRTLNTSAASMSIAASAPTLNFNIGFLPEGEYYGILNYNLNDVLTPVHFSKIDSGTISIKKTSSGTTATVVRAGDIQYGTLEILSPFYIGRIFAVNLPYTYTGESDYLLPVVPMLKNTAGSYVAQGEQYNAIITPGEGTIEYAGTWIYSLNGAELTTGNYKLELTTTGDNGDRKVIAGPVDITMDQTSGSAYITVNSSDWSISNAENIDPYHINIDVKVNCRMGYFAGTIIASIYEHGNSTNTLAELSSKNIFISKGETKSITIDGEFIEAEAGKTYDVILYSSSGSKLTTQAKSFTISTSGLDSVIGDTEADAPVEYFNLQGQPVETPAAGSVVIRRQGDKVQKIIVK